MTDEARALLEALPDTFAQFRHVVWPSDGKGGYRYAGWLVEGVGAAAEGDGQCDLTQTGTLGRLNGLARLSAPLRGRPRLHFGQRSQTAHRGAIRHPRI